MAAAAVNNGAENEGLQNLRDWVRKQPYYPNIPDDILMMFLSCRNYDLDMTKKTIQSYLDIASCTPEIFSNMDPLHPGVQQQMSILNYLALPDRDSEGRIIIICSFADGDASKFDFVATVKLSIMYGFLYAYELEKTPAFIYILDSAKLQFGHVRKVHIYALKKFLNFLQDAFPIDFQQIHVLNAWPGTKMLFNIMKLFMSRQFADKFEFYSSNLEKFYEKVPRHILPSDYGGSQKSVSELQNMAKKNLLDKREILRLEEKLRLL